MRRSVGIYILLVLLVLPVAWLAATTPVTGGGRASALFAGAVITDLLLLRMAWRAHRAGALLPNTCRTCDSPMALSRPGEVRPPGAAPGTAPASRYWRCRRCGRLVRHG